jgi:uncharacterized protein (TIGR03437 family)
VEPLITVDPLTRRATQLTIDLGPETDEVRLVFFATGLRFRSSLAGVKLDIDGVDAPVEYAGSQGELPGLDQVNARLPRSLAGRGAVAMRLVVDGHAANVSSVIFR